MPVKVFNDQRLSQLDDIPEFQTHSAVLKKMYMMQILNKKELDCFEKSLADHQKAVMGDGLTIVERAAIEHNILSVGRLYYNIFFAELGRLLGIDRVKAERVAAKMIIDGRLKASIDQVDDLLHFECDETSLTNWDHAITSVCVQLTKVADNIQADV